MIKTLIFRKDKKAVVWISTIVYTLIGLSIIAILLAVVNPRIKELKDSFVIKQTIVAMGDFDDIILDIRKAEGNKRYYEIHLSRGNFKFDCTEEFIEWILKDSSSKASEPGVPYNHGNIQVLTEENNKEYIVSLKTDYSNLDLTCGEDGLDNEIILNPASTPYKVYVENKGGTITEINIVMG